MALIQLRGRFAPQQPSDRRLRTVNDDSYIETLFDALRFGEAQEANFIVFPEYAWPRAAAARVVEYLRGEHRNGTAWLFPFEHLSLSEYEQLLSTFAVPEAVQREELSDLRSSIADVERQHAFVNVAFLAVVADDGLHVVPHRKMRPAALEEHEVTAPWRFRSGKRRLRVVQGSRIRVAVLICFDLIARDDQIASRPRTKLASEDVDLILVPECNPAPLHTIYLRAITAFYQAAEEATVQPRLCIVNMAAGTRLPGIEKKTHFGFSRIVGDLGKVARLNDAAALAFEGFVANVKADSLDEVASLDTARVDDERFRTVVIRPEATFASAQIPPLHRLITNDPTAGRRNSEVDCYLPLRAAEPPWNRVRLIADLPTHEPPGIPLGLQDEVLIGTDATEAEFIDRLAINTPTYVTGEPGVGKTVLVASVLRRIGAGVRVVWIDMGQVEHDEHALVEALLIAFGATRALTERPETQAEILRAEASLRPTMIVLDSFDRWEGAPLPASVKEVVQWNVWLVITDRARDDAPQVIVTPLPDDHARELMWVRGAVPRDSEYANTMVEIMLGVPLAHVWAAEIYRESPIEAERVRRALEQTPEADRTFLFRAIVEQLPPLARQVLGVLCELAAPLSLDDLAFVFKNQDSGEVASSGEIQEAALALADRSLIMHAFAVDGTTAGVTFRHPSIQMFWRLSAADERPALVERALDWCEHVLKTHGGERNWRGLRPIGDRWANIGYLIRRLARDGSPAAVQRFMTLWRLADTYLWTSGRWRERRTLGEYAVAFAQSNDWDARAYALYESWAQAEWHLHCDQQTAEPLIREAIEIYDRLGDLRAIARAQWNLSRMLRHCGAVQESLNAAQVALQTAIAAGDLHSIALALHGIGASLLKLEQLESADIVFRIARRLFIKAADDEMVAVIDRNLGHLLEKRGRYAAALRKLEAAMDAFVQMGMTLEEAEAALYHARTLAKLHERTDAQRQFERAKTVIERLGSRVRRDQIEVTARVLAQAAEWID